MSLRTDMNAAGLCIPSHTITGPECPVCGVEMAQNLPVVSQDYYDVVEYECDTCGPVQFSV